MVFLVFLSTILWNCNTNADMALQTPNTAWCDPNTNDTIAARDRKDSKKVVILGAGLTGLAAGYTLSAAGQAVLVLEEDSTVGGLAKTIRH